MEQFVVDDVQLALIDDSLPSTHAMSTTVGSPAEIMDIFDSITYSKGIS
jgi:aminopeptidase N